MLPACELSSGTSPAATRPTSTASNTLRTEGNATRSASGQSASAPASELAPASPWYATTSILGAYEALGSQRSTPAGGLPHVRARRNVRRRRRDVHRPDGRSREACRAAAPRDERAAASHRPCRQLEREDPLDRSLRLRSEHERRREDLRRGHAPRARRPDGAVVRTPNRGRALRGRLRLQY